MARRQLDVMAGVEEEIRGERASALGHSGERLEALLVELAQLRAAAEAAPPSERPAQVAAHNACRARAERLYEQLCIQREAMGVRSHDMLAATYPIPKRLRE
jgi:hypothetical protein